MERTWTEVGKEHTENRHKRFEGVFSRLDWQSVPCTMGAGQGLALKGVVEELQIPNVSHVASSHELAPYSLLGIKAKYKNGHAVIYMLDRGNDVVIVASDFEANESGVSGSDSDLEESP